MKSYGFSDCWEIAGCPWPIKTCRFDTRIDYIYANEAFLKDWALQEVKHIDDNASDHNMVLATFCVKEKDTT